MTTFVLASTVVAAPLIAIAWIARRFRSSIEELAWRLVVIAMLAIPIASQLPKTDIGVDLPMITPAEVVFYSNPPMTLRDDAPWWLFVPSIALLARLAFALMRTRGITARVPVVVGLLRPRIVMPPDVPAWSDEKRDAVLAHENAHVRRRDPLWRFLAQLTIAIHWFHPFAWLAAAALERLAEDAADREAVAATGDARRYAEVLLDVASAMTTTHRRILASAMLDRRSLTRRIDAILAARAAPRTPWIAHALVIALATGSVFVTAMTKRVIVAPVVDFALREQLRTELREAVRSLVRYY